MFKRAAIATSVNAWGWQPHHTVITLCIFSHSISLSICVCVCVYIQIAYRPLGRGSAATLGAELRLHLLTQNPDKVSNLFPLRESLRLPATSLYPLSYPGDGSQCKPGRCRGGLKIPCIRCHLQHWAAERTVRCLHCPGKDKKKKRNLPGWVKMTDSY